MWTLIEDNMIEYAGNKYKIVRYNGCKNCIIRQKDLPCPEDPEGLYACNALERREYESVAFGEPSFKDTYNKFKGMRSKR